MGARELVFKAELRVRYRPGQDPDSLERTIAAEGRRAADRRLQLNRAEASRALRASARELASLGLNTRQIAAVLTLFTGSALPRQTVWRMLRSE